MTFEEYLEFLEDYWEIFGPLPTPVPRTKDYEIVLL